MLGGASFQISGPDRGDERGAGGHRGDSTACRACSSPRFAAGVLLLLSGIFKPRHASSASFPMPASSWALLQRYRHYHRHGAGGQLLRHALPAAQARTWKSCGVLRPAVGFHPATWQGVAHRLCWWWRCMAFWPKKRGATRAGVAARRLFWRRSWRRTRGFGFSWPMVGDIPKSTAARTTA